MDPFWKPKIVFRFPEVLLSSRWSLIQRFHDTNPKMDAGNKAGRDQIATRELDMQNTADRFSTRSLLRSLETLSY